MQPTPGLTAAANTRHRAALQQLQQGANRQQQQQATSKATDSGSSASASFSLASRSPTAVAAKENPHVASTAPSLHTHNAASTSSRLAAALEDAGRAGAGLTARGGSAISRISADSAGLGSFVGATQVQGNMGAIKERVQMAGSAARGGAMSSSATSSATGTPLRQTRPADNSDEEESDAFVLRSTPMAPLFTPVPLTRPQTVQQQSSGLSVSQRMGRELTPQAGRLADLRSAPARASIFPSDASASSSGVSSGVGSTAEVAVLQHGLAQILATKDSAKRYIELMRKRMGQYIALNREYANTHASEQLRNKGILSLRKTLSSRIEQLDILQKTLQAQQTRRDVQNRAQVDELQEELREARAEIDELRRASKTQSRAESADKREQKKELEHVKAQLEQQLEEQKLSAEAAENELRSELQAARAAREQSASEATQLGELVNDLQSQLSSLQREMQRKEDSWQRERQRAQQMEQARLQAAAAAANRHASPTKGAPPSLAEQEASHQAAMSTLRTDFSAQLSAAENELSSATEHSRRLEVSLANACGEVERLQSELVEAQTTSQDAIGDLQVLLSYNERSKRSQTRQRADRHRLEAELEQSALDARRKQIQLDEMSDMKDAFQQAYESTLSHTQQLQTSVSTLVSDVTVLRQSLVELMLEQSSTIPLPTEVLDSNPELAIMLVAGADDDEGAFTGSSSSSSRASAAPSSSSPLRSFLSGRAATTASSAPSSPGDDDGEGQLSSLSDSLSGLNLDHVARRLSMTTSPNRDASRTQQHARSAPTSTHSSPAKLFQRASSTVVAERVQRSSMQRIRALLDQEDEDDE